MKASIPRTAAFAWSPSSLPTPEPYLATGTLAGALDENFSNESVIEIWQPDYRPQDQRTTPLKPIASTPTNAKLHRLVWGFVHKNYPKGLLAAGLENGELCIWDAAKLIDGKSDAQILRNTSHTGSIRGLEFSSVQPNLLASGAVNGEIYIWDVLNPGKPYTPGPRSPKLDDITSLAWNPTAGHILATASSSGHAVVWNLKEKKELASLTYGGGAINGSSGAGGRRPMSAVAWNPGNSTKLVTACDDDSSPLIHLWSLRNTHSPEKVLTGHDKGILGLSWCKEDPDLLLSCGKDNRTIAWNPSTSEVVGELPPSSNWSFDVQFSPRNPALIATASFDGQVGITSLQAANQTEQQNTSNAAPAAADGSDFFDNLGASTAYSRGLSLKQAPKWLRRPVSATFGFGGQLVSIVAVSAPPQPAEPQTQPQAPVARLVNIRDVVTEPAIVARATRLQEAVDSQSLAQFCDEKSREASQSRPDEAGNWKALQTLFQADSRDELVALLGFSKEEVASKVADAIQSFKSGAPASVASSSAPGTPAAANSSSHMGDVTTPHEPVVSFAEQSAAPTSGSIDGQETTASEASTTTSSEPKATTEGGLTEGGDSEVTEPSLFSDDHHGAPAAPGSDADFFNSLTGESGAGVRSAVPERVLVPHTSFPPASSVAATAGSPGPSSVASADLRPTTFRIYPSDSESEADKLITRALVLGDFESAVSLCVSTDRFADALLLAVRGGPELLARTQKTYFERRTTSLPYLRLFQSIVSNDLTDVVQNGDLQEWQEIFVVLCTFATGDEFSNLVDQLGQRLEFQYVKAAGRQDADASQLSKAKQHRKNAILCYLAAGKLEKVAGMWIEEMKEQEAALRASRVEGQVNGNATGAEATSLYSAHAEALQTFIEKITVFQTAVGYVDADLQQPTLNEEVAASGARTYKLAALYDRIHEYVELLADQGLVTPALKYINQTPADYVSSGSTAGSSAGVGRHPARERLLQTDAAKTGGQGARAAAASVSNNNAGYGSAVSSSAYAPAPSAPQAYDPYGQTQTQSLQNAYSAPTQDNYGQQQPQQQQQQQQPQTSYYAPAVPQVPTTMYSATNGAYDQQQQSQSGGLYAPAAPMVPAAAVPSPYGIPSQQQPQLQALAPPPPPKRADSGWNDVPALPSAPRRAPSALGNKSAPITSPFPNASPAASPMPYGQGQPQQSVGPPPRGPTPGGRPGFASPPPPPQGPPQGYGRPPSQGPPGVRPPPQQQVPPPPRTGSAAGMRPPPQQQGAMPPVPPMGGNAQRQPPGPYGPGPGPTPQQQQQLRQAPAPPGPYGPPVGMQQQQQQQQQQPPRPPPGVRSQTPGQAPPNRSHTPGAGAGRPTSAAAGGPTAGSLASQFKYPPGDRSHVPENQRFIVGILSRELARVKSTSNPSQKRMMDDMERRINLLFDCLNNSLIDGKVVAGLTEVTKAIEGRNQPLALQLHVGLVTSAGASGEVQSMLTGIKFLISRLNS